MVIDARESEVFERSGPQRVEQTAFGVGGVDASGDQSVERARSSSEFIVAGPVC